MWSKGYFKIRPSFETETRITADAYLTSTWFSLSVKRNSQKHKFKLNVDIFISVAPKKTNRETIQFVQIYFHSLKKKNVSRWRLRQTRRVWRRTRMNMSRTCLRVTDVGIVGCFWLALAWSRHVLSLSLNLKPQEEGEKVFLTEPIILIFMEPLFVIV